MVNPSGVPNCFKEADHQSGAGKDYSCLACDGLRSLKVGSIRRHCQNESHLSNLKEWEARQNATASPIEPVAIDLTLHPHELDGDESDEVQEVDDMITTPIVDSNTNNENLDRPQTLLDLWTRNHTAAFDPEAISVNNVNNDDASADDSDRGDEADFDEDKSSECELNNNTDPSGWAPFTSLEQLVGVLLLGSSRTTSRVAEYERTRSYVSLLKVTLPGYKSVRNCRDTLKKRYGFEVAEALSPSNKPCFLLKVQQILSQELSNPYVAEHLQFMPELPSSTTKTNRLSQSKKWREELDRDLRVQMVNLPQGHFYLYEPVQLQSKQLVIPLFFLSNGK